MERNWLVRWRLVGREHNAVDVLADSSAAHIGQVLPAEGEREVVEVLGVVDGEATEEDGTVFEKRLKEGVTVGFYVGDGIGDCEVVYWA